MPKRDRYKPRHGFTAQQVSNLNNRWRKCGLVDGMWSGFDDFLKWSAENGFQDGARLGKFNENIPHGPGNSFWYVITKTKKEPKPVKKKTRAKPKETPPEPVRDLCESCTRECTIYENGCAEWYENFKKYWDAHIHRKVDIPQVPECGSKGREHFQYEHPDLVREGIRFRG